jgi:hypothetical protein
MPSFTLTDILDQNAPWRSHLPANFRPLEHFRDYVAFGYHPFALEDKAGYHQRLQQMVRQVVEFDMAELQG